MPGGDRTENISASPVRSSFLKMNGSNRVSDIATLQYINAVLKSYGIVPMKENFSRFCNSSDQLKSVQSTLSPNDIGLTWQGRTAKHKSGEESSVNVEKRQIPLTVEQPSQGCHTTEREPPKITQKDVLRAHGII